MSQTSSEIRTLTKLYRDYLEMNGIRVFHFSTKKRVSWRFHEVWVTQPDTVTFQKITQDLQNQFDQINDPKKGRPVVVTGHGLSFGYDVDLFPYLKLFSRLTSKTVVSTNN